MRPSPNEHGVGVYHLAWEVDEIDALREARDALERHGSLVGASDHGATKSIYGYDLDGNEFESAHTT
jgi:catechol-2,3-dioxygenase